MLFWYVFVMLVCDSFTASCVFFQLSLPCFPRVHFEVSRTVPDQLSDYGHNKVHLLSYLVECALYLASVSDCQEFR